MKTYLLDTNACIALINGTEINVRRRFKRAVARESVILLSSIVAFELWHGVAKSQRKDSNTQRLETFLGGPLEWALFDEDDARAAGTVRAELETVGRPVGAYDVLLSGQARNAVAIERAPSPRAASNASRARSVLACSARAFAAGATLAAGSRVRARDRAHARLAIH